MLVKHGEKSTLFENEILRRESRPKKDDNGKSFIVRNSMICTVHLTLSGVEARIHRPICNLLVQDRNITVKPDKLEQK